MLQHGVPKHQEASDGQDTRMHVSGMKASLKLSFAPNLQENSLKEKYQLLKMKIPVEK